MAFQPELLDFSTVCTDEVNVRQVEGAHIISEPPALLREQPCTASRAEAFCQRPFLDLGDNEWLAFHEPPASSFDDVFRNVRTSRSGHRHVNDILWFSEFDPVLELIQDLIAWWGCSQSVLFVRIQL